MIVKKSTTMVSRVPSRELSAAQPQSASGNKTATPGAIPSTKQGDEALNDTPGPDKQLAEVRARQVQAQLSRERAIRGLIAPRTAPKTAKPTQDKIDLHAIWYSKSALNPSPNSSPAFKSQLGMSYLQLTDSMHGASPNVKGHLWTDRAPGYEVPKHFVGPNGTDIEISDTLLRKGRVVARPESDLQAMVNGVQDADLRKTVQKLQDHPANENIGLRADVLRQVVTTLHERPDGGGQVAERLR